MCVKGSSSQSPIYLNPDVPPYPAPLSIDRRVSPWTPEMARHAPPVLVGHAERTCPPAMASCDQASQGGCRQAWTAMGIPVYDTHWASSSVRRPVHDDSAISGLLIASSWNCWFDNRTVAGYNPNVSLATGHIP